MKDNGEAPGSPTAAQIRASLARITASAPFQAAPKLRAFLSYVVEATLDGNGARLKGYTVAVEALGRPDSFDPSTDAIVRVEANRLRTALARYYAGPGSDDPVLISICRGSYVPSFRVRPACNLVLHTNRVVERWADILRRPRLMLRLARRYRPAASIAVIAIAVGLGTALTWRLAGRSDSWMPAWATMTSVRANAMAQPSRRQHVLPIVAIEPFEEIGAPTMRTTAMGRFAEKLRDALAHFDELHVAAAILPASLTKASSLTDAEERADYRIGGTLEYQGDGSTNITIRLIDTGDDVIVWSRSFDHVAADSRGAAATDGIVRKVAGTLAELNGAIQSLDRRKADSLDPRYACLLTAIDGWRKYEPATQERARACLQDVTRSNPSFAVAFAFLAHVYLRDEYLFHRGPALVPARDRALETAQRAVELKPNSARAYATLMRVYGFRREKDAAIDAGRKAIALNPYDSLTAAELGYRHLLFGDVRQGLALMRANTTPSRTRPVWFNFGLCLGAYLSNELGSAAMYCNAMTAKAAKWALMLRAVVAAKSGDEASARYLRDALFAASPAWRDNPAQQIGKLIAAPTIVARLSRELMAIGGDERVRTTASAAGD
jgi:TolB-like protein